MLTAILVILAVGFIAIRAFVDLPQFGARPSGARLERIRRSPYSKGRKFENINPTPNLSEDASFAGVLYQFLFKRSKSVRPSLPIPSVKTNLKDLPDYENFFVWFGHSSYILRISGFTILVDPVFGGKASPIPGSVTSFKGSDIYTADDMPEIDLLFLSHDHWDHLDYPTVVKLKSKVKRVITGLGTGENLEFWGYDPTTIHELEWYESIRINEDIYCTALPARHFSGRSLKRNETLWISLAVHTRYHAFYLGGDSGFDTHFEEIGNNYGPFDFAILENGQYDKAWKYIHMQPNEVLQAASHLHAKYLIPVHSAKFGLANHDWDTPLKTISSLSVNYPYLKLLTPRIGEIVRITDDNLSFDRWWENVNSQA
jgi:L-ascorbate metabolism protein UlaG (beta-lactamase superfamily)